MKSIFLALTLFIIHNCNCFANTNDSLYLGFSKIIISSKTIIEPTQNELDWGRQVLKNLKLDGMSSFEKAKAIQKYISKNYKYRIRSPRTIQGFVDNNGGNCLSHSIMGLFLLRLSGTPAKLCYEFHIRSFFIIDQWRAYFQKAAYFGAAFNSHIWLLFYDGNDWQPYDSALDITGFDEFFAVRTRTQRWPYFLSFNPKRMTGAPFIIEQETGTGFTKTEVITNEIWDRKFEWKNQKVSKEEWFSFLKLFEGKSTKDFTFPIDKERKRVLKAMSKKWF